MSHILKWYNQLTFYFNLCFPNKIYQCQRYTLSLLFVRRKINPCDKHARNNLCMWVGGPLIVLAGIHTLCLWPSHRFAWCIKSETGTDNHCGMLLVNDICHAIGCATHTLLYRKDRSSNAVVLYGAAAYCFYPIVAAFVSRSIIILLI